MNFHEECLSKSPQQIARKNEGVEKKVRKQSRHKGVFRQNFNANVQRKEMYIHFYIGHKWKRSPTLVKLSNESKLSYILKGGNSKNFAYRNENFEIFPQSTIKKKLNLNLDIYLKNTITISIQIYRKSHTKHSISTHNWWRHFGTV